MKIESDLILILISSVACDVFFFVNTYFVII